VAKSLCLVDPACEKLVEDVVRAFVELVDTAGAELGMRLGLRDAIDRGGRLDGQSRQAAPFALPAAAAGAEFIASDLGHRFFVAASFAGVSGTSFWPPGVSERAGNVDEGLRIFLCARCGRGHLFVFLNRRGHMAQLLFWDRTGFCVVKKRLESGPFRLPRTAQGTATHVEIDSAELALTLEGIELTGAKRRKRYVGEAA
jgi:hypothetical protein